jgi:hypothetical protein
MTFALKSVTCEKMEVVMLGNSEFFVVVIAFPVLFQIVLPLAIFFSYGLFALLRSLFVALNSGKLMYIPYAGRSYSLIESESVADLLKAGINGRVIYLRG